MIRKLESPVEFAHVDDLRNEYGNKFLVLTNCDVTGVHPGKMMWGKAGTLKAVCDTYREVLEACRDYYKDEEQYGFVMDYHFPYTKGVTTGDFRYP